MKKIGLFLLLGFSLSWLVSACQERQQERRKEVPLDSIVLSDPCILADRKTAMYYMTGTGGMLWKSKDLKLWEGPFHVAKTDSGSWMGPKPMIWAAELHPYKGKYYYFATFTNQAVKIDTVQGNVIERRASHVLVSDNPDGPYVPMKDSTYLPADKPTLDGTFWVDKDGKPYMVYCYEWLQALDGTIEKIELKPNVRTVIDIGGQDIKAISIDEHGAVKNFLMNDKCAAGTGRFLEMMARTLGLSLEEMSVKGLDWKENVVISSMCTVFAESEVVSLVAQNKEVSDIIHGLNVSVASKVGALAARLGKNNPGEYMMTGGVAKNQGIIQALEEKLGAKLYICDEAQLCGALGAAIFAYEKCKVQKI